jgi:nucleoside-diphosphate-sugar epimerase
MAKRALITGLSGFVGCHVAEPLQALGFELFGVGRGAKPAGLPAEWHQADLLRPGSAAEVISATRPTHLLHFAWYAEHQKFWRSPLNTSWVRATLELLQAFRESGGGRAVLAGSCAEYDWNYPVLSELSTPRAARTPFGRSKNALFEAAEAYSQTCDLSFSWGRIFFVYGPGEHPGRLVSHVVTSLLAGKRAATSSGTQVRDFMHAADIAAAFAALLDSEVQGALNIASGEPRPVREVIEAVGRLTGRADLLDIGAIPISPQEPTRLEADVTRMRSELRFTPAIPLQDGLRSVIDSYRRAAAPTAAT